MYRLEIEGVNADLDNLFDVSLSYKSINLLDPISRQGGFTYSLDIVKSNNNNKIFNYIDNDDSIDKFKKSEFDCILYYENQQIIKGIFYLDEINKGYYKGQIISETVNWVNKIPDEFLQVITSYTISYPTNDYSAATLNTPSKTINNYNEFANADNSDINFPFITYGNYNYGIFDQNKNSIISKFTSIYAFNSGTRLSVDDMIPSMYYVNSIKKIFETYDIDVKCSIFNDIKDIIVPYVGTEEFKFNWNELGHVIYINDPFDPTYSAVKDYFGDFDLTIINYDNGSINPYVSSLTGVTEYRGFGYKARTDGKLLIKLVQRNFNVNTKSIAIFQGFTASVTKVYEQSGDLSNFEIDVSKGDNILIMAATNNVRNLLNINAYITSSTNKINPFNILPEIKIIDWIKNFINLFGLYPIYNSDINTLYLLTLDEYLLNDQYELRLNTEINKKYPINNIGLRYTYDRLDGLVFNNEFSYNITNNSENLTSLFSPSKKRPFVVSNLNGSNNAVNLISIASADAIDTDRLSIDRLQSYEYLPWSSTTTYAIGDKVTTQNRFFVCVIAHTNQNPIPNTYYYWGEDFSPLNFISTFGYDYNPRILTYDGNVNSATTGNYVDLLGEKTFIATSSFEDQLDMTKIYNNYYAKYNTLINNRTSIVEGQGYLPRYKFFQYINRPVEIMFKADIYIIIEITNYNPKTELGTFKLIKKVDYINYI